MSKNSVLFSIECISNLHVGAGESDDSIIDKVVQRDVITELPCIHASGLKGAVREYFKSTYGKNDARIAKWFGSDKDEKINLNQGLLRFTDAQMLMFPVRGADENPYYLGTSNNVINQFNSSNLDFDLEFNIALEKLPGTAVTEVGNQSLYDSNLPNGNSILNLDFINLKSLSSENLPVIARNCLENGESVNLWYEEFVPKKTVFYFYLVNFNSDEPDNNDLFMEFVSCLDKTKIQIGANGTIGYGLSLLNKLI